MKFGVREICDVVLKAKAAQKIGDKVFYKNEPVLYFDSLKTSSMEGQATTVYAQGGRGNARLIAWEGERTVTFTMEDALISPAGFSILTGAGLVQADSSNKIIVHKTEQTDAVTVTYAQDSTTEVDSVSITLSDIPYVDSNKKNSEDFIYVMLLDDNGEVKSEPFIATESSTASKTIKLVATETDNDSSDDGFFATANAENRTLRSNNLNDFKAGCVVLVDYYVEKDSNAFQVDITPDKFGGNFYLEASTLFRGTNGVDMPAEFIIPNCKIQSNFTFTMASSGDPSTFTFTMDAFPDYTRWNKTKKVYAAIQVIEESDTLADFERLGTTHDNTAVATVYNRDQKPYIED